MSWKKFGGIKQLDTFNNLNTNSITTDDFVMREAYKGTFTISGELYVNEDCSLNGNVLVGKSVYVGKSAHVHDRVFIGDNNVRFLKNNEQGLGLDVPSPQSILDISGSNSHILHVFSSQESVKSTLVQNKSLNKTVLQIDNSSASLMFHIRDNSASLVYDVCQNKFILDKDVFLKKTLVAQGNVTINNDLLVLDDTTIEGDLNVLGNVQFDGTLSLNNDLNMKGNLFVNRDTTMRGLLTVGNIILEKHGGLYLREIDINRPIIRKQIESDVSSTNIADNNKKNYLNGNSIALTDNVLIKGNLFIEGETNIIFKGVQNGILKDLSGTDMTRLHVNYLSTTVSNEKLQGAGFYIYNRYPADTFNPDTIINADGFVKVSDMCNNKLSFRSIGSERHVIALNFSKINKNAVPTGLMVMQDILNIQNNKNDNYDIVSSHHVDTIYVNSSLESVHNIDASSIDTNIISTRDLIANNSALDYCSVNEVDANTMDISTINTNSIVGKESIFNNIQCTGKAKLQNTDISGNLIVFQSSIIYGNVELKQYTIGNTLLVQNNATIQKDVRIFGNIYAYHDISLNGALNINNNVTIGATSTNQDLIVKKHVTIGDDKLDNNQAVTIIGDLSMNGNAFIDSIVVRKNLKTSDICCNGNISLNNGNFDLTSGSLKGVYNGNLYTLSGELLYYLKNINTDVQTKINYLSNNLNLGSELNNKFTGINTFTGNTILGNTILNSAIVLNTTSINKDLFVGGKFEVTGKTNLHSTTVSGDLFVFGNISGSNTFTGINNFVNQTLLTNMNVSDTLTVLGKSFLDETAVYDNINVLGKRTYKKEGATLGTDTITYFVNYEKGILNVKKNIICSGFPVKTYVYKTDGIAESGVIEQFPDASDFFASSNPDKTITITLNNEEIEITPTVTEQIEGGIIDCYNLQCKELNFANKCYVNGNLVIGTVNYTPSRLKKTLELTNESEDGINVNKITLNELIVSGASDLGSLNVNNGSKLNNVVAATIKTDLLTSSTINVEFLNFTTTSNNTVTSITSDTTFAVYRNKIAGFSSSGILMRQDTNAVSKVFVYIYEQPLDLVNSNNRPPKQDLFFIGTAVVSGSNSKVDIQQKGNLIVNIYDSEFINTGRIFVNENITVSGDMARVTNITGSNDISMSGNMYSTHLVLTKDLRCVNIYGSRDISINGDFFGKSSMYISKDISVNGNLNAFSSINLSKNLIVSGDMFGKSSLFVTNDISLGGNLYGLSNMTVYGNVFGKSSLFVTNDISLGGNLYGLSNMTVYGNVFGKSSLFVTNDISLGGNLYGMSNMTVYGNVFGKSSLFVTNDISLGGNLYGMSNMTVYGNVFGKSSLFITNDISLGGNLYGMSNMTVYGNVFGKSSMFINKDISLGGNLYGLTDMTVYGNVFGKSSIFVTNDISLGGNLYGLSNMTVYGNVFGKSSLFVTNDISLGGNLYGMSNMTVYGNVFGKSSIFVTNDISLGGNLYGMSNMTVYGNVFGKSSMFINKDISLGGNLYGMTDMTVYGNVFGKSSIFVTNDISLGGNLYGLSNMTVYGNVFGKSSIFVTNDISLGGNLYGMSNMTVYGNVFGKSSMFINNDISLGGNLYGLSNMTVYGNVFGKSSMFINNDISLGGYLYGLSNMTVYGNVFCKSSIFVTNDISLGGNLYGLSNMTVYGNVFGKSSIFVTNDISLGGNLYGMSNMTVYGNVFGKSSMFINKDISLGGNLYGMSNMTVYGNVFGKSSIFVTNDISLSGNLYGMTDMTVYGNVFGKSSIFINKDISLGGNLYGMSNMTVYGNVFGKSSIFVTNDISLSGNLYGMSDMTVYGNVFGKSSIFINKDISLGGNLYGLSNMTVYGNVFGKSSIFVTNDISLSGNLYGMTDMTVYGNVFGKSSIFINKDISLSGNLYGLSNMTVYGNVFGKSSLFVTNDISLSGNLYGMSNMTLSKDATVYGNVFSKSSIFVTNDISLSGNLYGMSNTTVYGNVFGKSSLFITNDISLGGNLYGMSNMTLSKDATVVGNLFGKSSLFITNDISLGGNLYGISNMTFSKNATVVGNLFGKSSLFVTNDISLGGNLYGMSNMTVMGNVFAKSSLFVTNDISLSGNLYGMSIRLNGPVDQGGPNKLILWRNYNSVDTTNNNTYGMGIDTSTQKYLVGENGKHKFYVDSKTTSDISATNGNVIFEISKSLCSFYTDISINGIINSNELRVKSGNVIFSNKSAILTNYSMNGDTYLILYNGSSFNIRCDSNTNGRNYDNSIIGVYPIIIENHATDWLQIKAYYNHVEKITFRNIIPDVVNGPNKIELYTGYGFGIESSTLKYLTSSYHKFYTGSSSNSNGNIKVTIDTNGLTVENKLTCSSLKVGSTDINFSNYLTSLNDYTFNKISFDFNNVDTIGPNKIELFSGFGFGIDAYTLKYLTSINHKFYTGSTSTGNGILRVNINNEGFYLYDINSPNSNYTKINQEALNFVFRNWQENGEFYFQNLVGTTLTTRFNIKSTTSYFYTGVEASSFSTAGDINLTGTAGAIKFNSGASKIYDNGDLYIYTDNNMYFKIDTATKLRLTTTTAIFGADVSASSYSTTGDINLTGTDGAIKFNGSCSKIYDNLHLHIYTDDYMYFDVGTTNPFSLSTILANFVVPVSATSYNATSDYRIKEDVKPLDENFTVDKLKPVSYHNTQLNKQDIGFIAHEVQEEYPFMVSGEKDGKDMQTLNYTSIIGILVKEIQDLKSEMKGMRETIARLQSKLES